MQFVSTNGRLYLNLGSQVSRSMLYPPKSVHIDNNSKNVNFVLLTFLLHCIHIGGILQKLLQDERELSSGSKDSIAVSSVKPYLAI